MTTPQQTTVQTTTTSDRLGTPEQVGELRQLLREHGWRADLGWAEVGARSASVAVHAAGGDDVRRTIAYLPALRTIDGGALRLWKHDDVAVPPVAAVREVMVATEGLDEWMTETFEVPPEHVEAADRETEDAGVAA